MTDVEYGNERIQIQVMNHDGDRLLARLPYTEDEVIAMYDTAFKTNKLYVEMKSKEMIGGTIVLYPIFTKSVVSFYNEQDDDYYGKLTT